MKERRRAIMMNREREKKGFSHDSYYKFLRFSSESDKRMRERKRERCLVGAEKDSCIP